MDERLDAWYGIAPMPAEPVRSAIRYAICTYALSWSAGAVVLLTGGLRGSPWTWLLYVSAWVPAVVAAVMRLVSGEGFRSAGWGLQRPRFLALALVPVLVFAAASAVVAIRSPIPLATGALGRRAAWGLGLDLLANAAFVFGEEFGWRGYLQDRVVAVLGGARGLLIMGLVWSFWHLPIDLLGYAFPEVGRPVVVLVLRPMSCIGLGAIIGLAYVRTRSIWVACLVHGTNNLVPVILALFLRPSAAQATILSVVGVLLYLALGVAALCAVRNQERRRAMSPRGR